jgi:histone chaperone ASF1
MSINVENVTIVNPQGLFSDDLVFDIVFECTAPVSGPIRWEVRYVGSATSSEHDQILTSVLTEPIEIGVNRFVLRADPPIISKIPPDELRLTLVVLAAYYQGTSSTEQEFIRIGYLVVNEFADELFATGEFPDPAAVRREIPPDEEPTVHRFTIKWE